MNPSVTSSCSARAPTHLAVSRLSNFIRWLLRSPQLALVAGSTGHRIRAVSTIPNRTPRHQRTFACDTPSESDIRHGGVLPYPTIRTPDDRHARDVGPRDRGCRQI